jgi:hypothetical protein
MSQNFNKQKPPKIAQQLGRNNKTAAKVNQVLQDSKDQIKKVEEKGENVMFFTFNKINEAFNASMEYFYDVAGIVNDCCAEIMDNSMVQEPKKQLSNMERYQQNLIESQHKYYNTLTSGVFWPLCMRYNQLPAELLSKAKDINSRDG